MDVNAKDSRDNTAPLYYAVCSNNRERVECLLDEGADVNAKDADQTPLVIAAVVQGGVEIIRLLVNAPGVDVNAKNSSGKSALFYAAYNNDLGAVKVLLEHGAQLDDHRCSEFWFAANKGDSCEMLKILLPYATKQRSPEKLMEHEFFRVLVNGSAVVMRHYLCHDRSLANVCFDDIDDFCCSSVVIFYPSIRRKLRVTPAHLLLNKAEHGSVFSKLKLLLEANADFEVKSDAFTSASVTPFQLAMIRGRYVEANLLAESGCVNIHNVRRFLDMDLIEEKIDELCSCKRRFRFCTYNIYGYMRFNAKLFAKPVHLVEMIRNPRSLLELSRVTVRKQLNRRIDRVQETGLPPALQDDVTRKHFNNADLDCYEPESDTCECGQPIIAF